MDFESDLANLLNTHGIDNDCNMQDSVLAEYLSKCITALYDANSEVTLLGGKPDVAKPKGSGSDG